MADPREGRRNNRLLIALFVSLAVNAFFLGAVITEQLRFRHFGGDHGPRATRMELRWLSGRLSDDAVHSIEAQLEPLKPDIVDRIDRLRQLRAELGVLLAAPEPDRAAIDSHLREIRLEVGAMQERIQSKTMDAVIALPAAERAPLATPAADRGKD